MDSRNGYDDYLYYTKISYYDTMIYKYFDSSSLYFIRNIHNGGVDTIKNVIKNEMSSINNQTSLRGVNALLRMEIKNEENFIVCDCLGYRIFKFFWCSFCN